MNLEPLSFALNQTSNLIANLNKKNFKTSVTEISNLISVHGIEADRHLFRCLFSYIDFSGDGHSVGKDFYQIQYLIQECVGLISKPNFITILCFAIDNPLHHQKTLRPSSNLCNQLSKILRLNKVQEVAFGIALLHSSSSELGGYAAVYVKQRLPQLLESFTNSSGLEGALQDIVVEVLHLLLTYVATPEFGSAINRDLKEKFLNKVRHDFPRERAPSVLIPILYPDQDDISLENLNPDSLTTPTGIMATSLADTVKEIGYGFTSSVEECRNNLMQLGVREITPPSIARVIGMMARHTVGLIDSIPVQAVGASNNSWLDAEALDQPRTWHVDNFVQALKDMAPHLNWREVVGELDHPGFLIPSKAGLHLVVKVLYRAMSGDKFPIELIYRPWKNAEGQLSWFAMSLMYSDVFCFAEHPHHKVNTECLKLHDEDNREIAVWKSLDLVDTLLRLQEQGLYKHVWELFLYPRQHCPDLLTLAILQIQSAWNRMKHELLSSMMPIFLANQFNATAVLHYAWSMTNQSQTIRSLILHSMSEWYMRGDAMDQSRLSRILDVAQDLKALNLLLNSVPHLFVIDLACLASRREFLKLDKWLADKVQENGEQFIHECLQYLKRKSPVLIQPSLAKDDSMGRTNSLPPDTILTMLQRLSFMCSTGNVSVEVKEMCSKLNQNAAMLFLNPRGAQPMVSGPPPPMLPPSKQVGGLPTNIPPPPGSRAATMSSMIDPLSALAASTIPGTAGSLVTSMAGPVAPGSPAKNPLVNPLASLGQQGGVPMQAAVQNYVSQMQVNISGMQGIMSQQQQPKNPIMPNLNLSALGLGLPISAPPPPPPQQQQSLRSMPPPPPPGQHMLERMRGLGNTPPISSAPGADLTTVFPNASQHFSKEIEEEANSYFQRIYNNSQTNPTMTIDEVLDLLKKFKDSSVKKEREVFACMLRNLFEEYKFFSQYPEKELSITAMLFGGIIEQGIVTMYDLGIALRYVLEALKKPPTNKMFQFGIAAVDRFRHRLSGYSQYCQHVKAIPHYNQFPQHLQEFVDYGIVQQEPPMAPAPPPAMPLPPAAPAPIVNPSTPVNAPAAHGAIARPGGPLPQKVGVTQSSIATATNIDTLLMGQESLLASICPAEGIQDKVFFIFNNLSIANMEQKGKDLRDCIGKDYIVWAAQYIVMRRASIEHNFHTLYSKLLDHLALPELTKIVVDETFRNVRVLLCSDKGANNFSDRSLLKNLGHWLGLVTLGKNRPIIQDELNLKSLLYEAFHKDGQEMLYVVPFVAKVMESAQLSKIFRPPNPWTMAIVRVLAELHQEPNLKLNLKFEIEVLCKTLGLELNDITPSQFLHQEDYDVEEPLLSTRDKPLCESSPEELPEEPLQINMPAPASTTTSVQPQITGSQTAFPVHPLQAISSQSTSTPTVVPRYTLDEVVGESQQLSTNRIVFNEQLPLFIAVPALRQLVRPALEKSVQEVMPSVIERSIRVCVCTCEQMLKKDFGLDPNEERIRSASYNMIRYMVSGMALISARDILSVQTPATVKTAFFTFLRGSRPDLKELIEQAAVSVTNDNLELLACYIQKIALDKAIAEVEKKLSVEFDIRRRALAENSRYFDRALLQYQTDHMPEPIRLKIGGPSAQQCIVYDEFALNIPGFTTNSDRLASQVPPFYTPSLTPSGQLSEEVGSMYQKLSSDMEAFLTQLGSLAPNHVLLTICQGVMDSIKTAQQARDLPTACVLVQKIVESLMEGFTPGSDHELLLRFRDMHLFLLKTVQAPRAFGPNWTNRQITKSLVDMREENRFNVDAVEALVRSHLLYVPQYDHYLASVLENGMNYFAVVFAMTLVQRVYSPEVERQPADGDFVYTVDALNRIAPTRNAPEGLMTLMEMLRQQVDNTSSGLDRALNGPTALMHSGITQAREVDDPSGLAEKTDQLFKEWVTMYNSADAGRDSQKAFTTFVGQMHREGILKTDDLITRFFRISCEIAVEWTYRTASLMSESSTVVRNKCYYTLDALVRLVALLVRHSGDDKSSITKVNLLNKVLGIIAGVMMQDLETRSIDFSQLPYHRIFIMLFIELNSPDDVLQGINYQVLTAFCNTFHVLRPSRTAGFAFSWLELISHRVFVGRMLALTPGQRGWGMYAQLLVDLFKFLAPFLRNAEIPKATQIMYRGTLRILLVLLHDFPEFLCDYHYLFCDVVPTNCIQLRNLLLSAFPRTMRLPDPFTPSLKVDQLPEVSQQPRIVANYVNNIQPASFKKDLDSYLKTRSPVTFLADMRSFLQASSDPGMRYNIQLMNALVLYTGVQAIQHITGKGLTPNMTTVAHSAHMDVFQNLAIDLDNEGRYIFLNAIANHLRYPNSHTHYFSCVLLYLFGEARDEAIQEQITRVLLERLIVNRPHPWGLLITFIELIKNPTLKFWSHEFVHCAPEIEKLFESVAKSFTQSRVLESAR